MLLNDKQQQPIQPPQQQTKPRNFAEVVAKQANQSVSPSLPSKPATQKNQSTITSKSSTTTTTTTTTIAVPKSFTPTASYRRHNSVSPSSVNSSLKTNQTQTQKQSVTFISSALDSKPAHSAAKIPTTVHSEAKNNPAVTKTQLPPTLMTSKSSEINTENDLKKNLSVKSTAPAVSSTSNNSAKVYISDKIGFQSHHLKQSINENTHDTPKNKKPISIVSPYATTSTTTTSVNKSLRQVDEPPSKLKNNNNHEKNDEPRMSKL